MFYWTKLTKEQKEVFTRIFEENPTKPLFLRWLHPRLLAIFDSLPVSQNTYVKLRKHRAGTLKPKFVQHPGSVVPADVADKGAEYAIKYEGRWREALLMQQRPAFWRKLLGWSIEDVEALIRERGLVPKPDKPKRKSTYKPTDVIEIYDETVHETVKLLKRTLYDQIAEHNGKGSKRLFRITVRLNRGRTSFHVHAVNKEQTLCKVALRLGRAFDVMECVQVGDNSLATHASLAIIE